MILTCPQCTTRYSADGAKFAPPGRNVRCSKCGHVWFQQPPPPAQEPEPVARIEMPAPAARRAATAAVAAVAPAPARPARAQSGWAASMFSAGGWAALVLVVLALAKATVDYRQEIATLWPQSASLYAMLSMPVNVRGIEFEAVTFRRETEDGQPVLAVTGKLVNVTARELPVPEIRVSLSDDEKRELYHWTFTPGVTTLGPHEESAFVTRLSSPPREARHLEVRFAQAGDEE